MQLSDSWAVQRDCNTYDEGNDVVGEKLVDDLVVEGNTERINGIISAAKRDDAGPSDRKPVSLDAKGLHESDVLLPEIVRVGSYIAITTVGGLSGSPAEIVPDRLAATVDIGGALDLECSCKQETGKHESGKALAPRARHTKRAAEEIAGPDAARTGGESPEETFWKLEAVVGDRR